MSKNLNMIAAIYLSYNPDIHVLNCSVQSALDECDLVYIYDNASENEFLLNSEDARVKILKGIDNIGIAGLNILAELAIEQGAEYLIILDQDSMLPKGYVSRALQYLGKCEAIVCPIYYDRERGTSSKCYNSKSFFKPSYEITDDSVEYLKTDIAIGSGMLFSSKLWKKLKGLNEDFFLDCADIDFCFRAKEESIPIYLDTKSRMEHSIGYGYINFFGIKISKHSPFRHYLYYKNIICLIFYKYPPIQWKVRVLIKLIFQIVIYSILSQQKMQNVKAACYAIRDSIFRHKPAKKLISEMAKVLK
ncbi:glycosyltransferase [Vibrio cholerae]|uniref:glycosyltransferase n=1 Tax=Vibrio cholerae TaxID=666 RepID=UPI000E0C0FFF|nr:glycosyltransferase family 2 protein [Vibrio cholerae]EGQ9836770.1 glycosyltransferase [Vibrio cholerae]EGR1835833.1 glycosyltransferase [Vibrio cholerae]EGR4363018.1 glycosyltransferase [Vibrio cholerae]EJL6717656.1 glycosyltransferase [Vibrio cholerae]ELJ8527713.1 glycosyltransferase [Vibrio cholerae]